VGRLGSLLRDAQIGLAASLVSDILTNWIRVLKTVKQVRQLYLCMACPEKRGHTTIPKPTTITTITTTKTTTVAPLPHRCPPAGRRDTAR